MSIYLHVYMHTTTCTLGAHRCQKNVRATETGIIDGWEPPCHCWEPNLRPLEELQVFFIINQPASLSSDLFVLFCLVWIWFWGGEYCCVLFWGRALLCSAAGLQRAKITGWPILCIFFCIPETFWSLSTRTCSRLHIFKCDAVGNTGNVGKWWSLTFL